MPFNEGESAGMGRDFMRLQEAAEWKSVAGLVAELRRSWTYRLLRLESDDIDKIALERVKWASMVQGLDTFFSDMEKCIESFKVAEKEARSKERKLNQ